MPGYRLRVPAVAARPDTEAVGSVRPTARPAAIAQTSSPMHELRHEATRHDDLQSLSALIGHRSYGRHRCRFRLGDHALLSAAPCSRADQPAASGSPLGPRQSSADLSGLVLMAPTHPLPPLLRLRGMAGARAVGSATEGGQHMLRSCSLFALSVLGALCAPGQPSIGTGARPGSDGRGAAAGRHLLQRVREGLGRLYPHDTGRVGAHVPARRDGSRPLQDTSSRTTSTRSRIERRASA